MTHQNTDHSSLVYLTDAEVAVIVGKKPRTIFNWRKARRPVHGLRVVQVGTVERWVIDPTSKVFLDETPPSQPSVLSPVDDSSEADVRDTRNQAIESRSYTSEGADD